MSGQRGSEKRQLTSSVLVRLEPELKARLSELAEVEGITLAAYARLRLAGGAATPRPAQAVLTSNLALIRELRHLGGLAKQLLVTREHAAPGREALVAIVAALDGLAKRMTR